FLLGVSCRQFGEFVGKRRVAFKPPLSLQPMHRLPQPRQFSAGFAQLTLSVFTDSLLTLQISLGLLGTRQLGHNSGVVRKPFIYGILPSKVKNTDESAETLVRNNRPPHDDRPVIFNRTERHRIVAVRYVKYPVLPHAFSPSS